MDKIDFCFLEFILNSKLNLNCRVDGCDISYEIKVCVADESARVKLHIVVLRISYKCVKIT